MNQSVSLDVSRDGLVAHMRDQFVHTDTFLRELLQNSRRAGASQIDVQFDPDSRKLVLSDDGRGIAAPEDLFVLGRSGFRTDPNVTESERPFGMGFAASLFAASFISIRTRSFSCEFNTESALRFGSIAINTTHPGLFFEGTRIEMTLSEARAKALAGVSEDAAQCLGSFSRILSVIAAGFPVPIRFNGEDVPRTHALSDEFVEHSGLFIRVDFPALRKAHLRCTGFREAQCYFQGLPLDLDGHRLRTPATVIHVGYHFRARTPDRDTLVDEQKPEFRAAKNAALISIWRDFLEQEKRNMPAEAFLTDWLDACRRFAPELINDLPLAPGMYDIFSSPPRHERYCGELRDSRHDHNGFLPVGSQVVSLDTSYLDEDEVERTVVGLYACLKGFAVIDPTELPKGHWARESCVSLDALNPSIEAQEVRGECTFESHFDSYRVVFCDHYSLDPQNGEDPIVVYDWPVWDATGCAFALLVPRKATAGVLEEVLLQAFSYIDEVDAFMESELDADVDRLATTARLMFDDDCSVLGGYLRQQLGSVCDALRGRRFSVEIDEGGQPTVKAA